MSSFPIFCVDNFYNNPDAIRDYALSLEYECSIKDTFLSGKYPGKRTKSLDVINPDFFHKTCKKLFSLFFNFEKEYHATNSYYCMNTRLTQLFFVNKLQSDNTYPLIRCQSEEL